MRAGSKWVYAEKDVDGSQRVEVTVTDRTKTIMGIEARVVHDVVTEDGELKEDTFDWYAQDKAGNLWYLGEDTKEYEDGKVPRPRAPGRRESTARWPGSCSPPTRRWGWPTGRSTTRARPRTGPRW